MKPIDLENNKKIETGFKIPEGYFEAFEAKMMGQIAENPVKVISIFKTTRFWIASIAALFLISITSIIYLQNNEITTVNEEEYLTTQTNLTTEEIVEHLTDDDILKIEASLNLYDTETINYAKEYLQ